LLTYHLLNIPVNPVLVMVISLSTSLVYNTCAIPLLNMNPHDSRTIAGFISLFKSRKTKLISVLCGLILFLVVILKMSTILLLFFMSLLCLIYRIPLIGMQHKRKNLREIYILKVFIIAIIWVVSTVYLPYAEFGKEIGFLQLLNLMVRQLLFIAAIALTFDIRDLPDDAKNSLYTVPVIIGKRNTKILCFLLLNCSFLLALFQQVNTIQEQLYPAFISVTATLLLVYFSNSSRNRYYYAFWLDGMCLFQYLITLAFTLGKL